MKNNGDIIPFFKQKDYIMEDNNLGKGSFGKTVLLKDPFNDELFVAKKYEPEYDSVKEEFYENFLDEIKILYKLNHPNIVRIYNYYAYEDLYTGYILMEHIDGTDIGNYMYNLFEFLDDVLADDIFIQLIDAFCYIEKQGIIHRDIRQSNILIDNSGVVKVIDFGIGKIFEKADISDSLNSQINRGGSDTLPNEYYDGTYTSKTDMFYLAELFNRLIKHNKYDDQLTFSYENIINKMKEKIQITDIILLQK